MINYSIQFKKLIGLKARRKSLLLKKSVDREALTRASSIIEPRFPQSKLKGLRRFKGIFGKVLFAALFIMFATCYTPRFALPPLKESTVMAETAQKEEIISQAFVAPVVLPHPGYLSTRFSNWHPGVDIASGLGMPVYPITSGTIEEVNYGFFGYGNNILISHPGGYKSLYAHLGRISAKKGQLVNSDNIIAEVGLTGHTSGPHTHLEVTKDGQYIDPLTILPSLANYPKEEYLKPYSSNSPSDSLVSEHKELRPQL